MSEVGLSHSLHFPEWNTTGPRSLSRADGHLRARPRSFRDVPDFLGDCVDEV